MTSTKRASPSRSSSPGPNDIDGEASSSSPARKKARFSSTSPSPVFGVDLIEDKGEEEDESASAEGSSQLKSNSKAHANPNPSPSSNPNSNAASSPNPKPVSLHQWLHPTQPPPLLTHSPGLHESSSTFVGFTISLVPPSHISTISALEKECRRIIRELDVISLVGEVVSRDDEGAFQHGEGRAPGRGKGTGKERVREPDHRMWACRVLALKEGRDGTQGEDDYQLLEAAFDDNEKYGGQTILRALRENNGVDVLSVCCRWYGGDMIGPIRFQHITTTVMTSLKSTLKLMALRDLRTNMESLDEEIASLRTSLALKMASDHSAENARTQVQTQDGPGKGQGKGKYDEIDDEKKLERLVMARERTKDALKKKVASS
ncbi:uncharacterized protein I303_103602 [Kwoniella dejecticola CBS 10117]|uniref:Impact N-terminal domain-containing protein n=1 Tax=Kwoniella dejecticola CBS 10117 TaxID=1296121 RepID=A0A1A6A776_9TREE|nr:uncharacterized protein I303_03624 [Kwoniella dejecticola CBS 10117]OBR85909.1 hypothetical protein I303_03624 [Kwoniella dejecticola CBS 10117]